MYNIISILSIVCDADLRRQSMIAQLCSKVSIGTLLRMAALVERMVVQHD